MIKGIFVGLLTAALTGLAGAYAFVSLGLMPANADANPGRLETWAARKSLHAAIRRQAPQGDNPASLNDSNLIAGIKVYAADCAVCHGAADARASRIAEGLYQKAPQFAKDGVEDDPEGVTYWKVVHGIRLTGMPSFGASLSQLKIWQVALFLRHMDGLTGEAAKAWKEVPSQGASK